MKPFSTECGCCGRCKAANDDYCASDERRRHFTLPMASADKIAVALRYLPPAQKDPAIDEIIRLLIVGLGSGGGA